MSKLSFFIKDDFLNLHSENGSSEESILDLLKLNKLSEHPEINSIFIKLNSVEGELLVSFTKLKDYHGEFIWAVGVSNFTKDSPMPNWPISLNRAFGSDNPCITIECPVLISIEYRYNSIERPH